jgi:hypothetical protein
MEPISSFVAGGEVGYRSLLGFPLFQLIIFAGEKIPPFGGLLCFIAL